MRSPMPCRRTGMTLVELLVVVAIIGLLAVTVLPNIANTAESRRTRETARLITTFIAQSQSKALGQATPTGFALLTTGTGSLASDPAVDVAPAKIPDAYRGDTPSATATLTANGLVMNLTFNPATTASFSTGDLIRFGGTGPWLELRTGTQPSCSLRSSGTAIDALAGQTLINTPWPVAGSPLTYEILRRPLRNGSAVTLGDGRCIDMAWSSAGQKAFSTLGSSQDNAVYVLFDAAGGVRQVVAGANRFSPDGPILLLVGRLDRQGNAPAVPPPMNPADDSTGANWQYADSIWIAIDQLSGICTSAACDAAAAAVELQGLTSTPTKQQTATALRASQNMIFSQLFDSGR